MFRDLVFRDRVSQVVRVSSRSGMKDDKTGEGLDRLFDLDLGRHLSCRLAAARYQRT